MNYLKSMNCIGKTSDIIIQCSKFSWGLDRFNTPSGASITPSKFVVDPSKRNCQNKSKMHCSGFPQYRDMDWMVSRPQMVRWLVRSGTQKTKNVLD